ncbi:DUF1446 domain-containing protein [Nocardia zapadnayensis]|nr:acyclic terpene utilization AtuA family protein [Nocardia zapadnayensis]MCX0273694.1 DUF1446 domain-containing protein [Nocardia zapadnayensis]
MVTNAGGFNPAGLAAALRDGSSVITKHSGDDGAVTVDTVTAQLVYEIQGPRYLNPDVTVHLDDVRLTADGPDRVRVDWVTGSPPPPTTKVAIFGQIGYRQVNTVYVTAPEIPAKVALLRRQLERVTPEGVHLRLTTLGTAATDPETQWDATAAVRILVTAADREALTRLWLARLLGSLYLQSYPGYFTDVAGTQRVKPGPRIEYWPGLLELDAVAHRVVLDARVLRAFLSTEEVRRLVPADRAGPNGCRTDAGHVAPDRFGASPEHMTSTITETSTKTVVRSHPAAIT